MSGTQKVIFLLSFINLSVFGTEFYKVGLVPAPLIFVCGLYALFVLLLGLGCWVSVRSCELKTLKELYQSNPHWAVTALGWLAYLPFLVLVYLTGHFWILGAHVASSVFIRLARYEGLKIIKVIDNIEEEN